MNKLKILRKYLPPILAWLSLAIILLVLIPMVYPVKLPVEYHVYHFILFWILFGIYYLNINYLVPVFYKKYKLLPYLLSIIAIGFACVLFMDFVSSSLNIRELIHQKLNPNEPYIKKKNVFIYFYIVILLAIILVTGIILQMVKKWNREEKNNIVLREEKAKAELMTLKAQIHPHFFFNTLNTIYALSHSDIPQSQEALLKLSKMMRFAMNEENREKVKLQEELEFVKNYLDLMKHRLPDNVQLSSNLSVVSTNLEIVPMILLTFIENCFKHGLTTKKNCDIFIETALVDNTFRLTTENELLEQKSNARNYTGIGIDNTIKRLDILYPEKYTYKSRRENGKYYCELQIDLK